MGDGLILPPMRFPSALLREAERDQAPRRDAPSTGSPPLRARTNITSRVCLFATGKPLQAVHPAGLPTVTARLLLGRNAELVVGHCGGVDKCTCHYPPATRGHAEAHCESPHRARDRVRRHLEAVHEQAGRWRQLGDVDRSVAAGAPVGALAPMTAVGTEVALVVPTEFRAVIRMASAWSPRPILLRL